MKEIHDFIENRNPKMYHSTVSINFLLNSLKEGRMKLYGHKKVILKKTDIQNIIYGIFNQMCFQSITSLYTKEGNLIIAGDKLIMAILFYRYSFYSDKEIDVKDINFEELINAFENGVDIDNIKSKYGFIDTKYYFNFKEKQIDVSFEKIHPEIKKSFEKKQIPFSSLSIMLSSDDEKETINKIIEVYNLLK